MSRLEDFREGGSEKHPRGIRSMESGSGNQINRSALEARIRRQGVDVAWRQAVESYGSAVMATRMITAWVFAWMKSRLRMGASGRGFSQVLL